jgi:hypothetical protein
MTSTRQYRVSSETTSVAKILWQGIFEVPWHQREFDWEPEHVKQFWDDIQRSVDSGEPDYFIGGITLTEQNEHLFDIQDGQQRLTTYSMMVAALRDVLPSQFKNDAQRIIYDIAHGSIPTNADNIRIKHQDYDRSNYAVIASGNSINHNGKLTAAQNVLRKKAESLDEPDAKKLFAYLLDSVIANRTINETGNATQVFETLNDRGKKLNHVDLLRNYLYSFLKGDRNDLHETVHRNLETMRREARDPKSDGQLIAYVRCALQCRYEPLRSNYLYQDAKSKIDKAISDNGVENAEETIRDLTSYLCDPQNIAAFKAVYKGDEFASEITAFTSAAGTSNHRRNMRDYVRELTAYKVALPVTFAVVSRFVNATTDPERRTTARAGHRVVQSLNALVMRTVAVQRSFRPTPLEGPIARWGHEIMEGIDNSTPNKLSAKMADTDPENVWEDNAFRESMNNVRMAEDSKAKRLLYALFRHDQPDLPNYNSLSVEHVLPESAAHLSGWTAFDTNSHERNAQMLGNMTLLAKSENKSDDAFNASFPNKQDTFRQSAILANREIGDYDDWSPNAIAQQQSKWATVACQVWKPHGPR